MSEQPTWTPAEGKALMMRTCASDMTSSHGSFSWPESGPVTADDWNPQAECGQGLHGLLWGAGAAGLLDWAADAKWLVVEVDTADIVGLGDKVKVPAGVVIYAGERHIAASLISAHAPAGTRVIAGTVTAGTGGTATAGYGGTATAGYGGTATAGDAGTATAGTGGTATAGYGGTATAGTGGTATAGDAGTATAGYAGTATAGYGGTATAGTGGTATAGTGGTATAGDGGTATAGYGGVIVITWWDSPQKRYRRAIGEVGVDGIRAGVAYHVVDGQLVPVEPIPDADLGPLLNATRIHTDDDGRHFDDQGREYEAVDVDGEVTYRLIGGGQ